MIFTIKGKTIDAAQAVPASRKALHTGLCCVFFTNKPTHLEARIEHSRSVKESVNLLISLIHCSE